MKSTKLILAALAVAFGWVVISTQSAAAAPGPLNVNSGQDVVRGHDEFGEVTEIIIERGGKLFICTNNTGFAAVGAPITFSNTGSGADPSIRVEPCLGAIGGENNSNGGAFTGTITLETDASITTNSATLEVNGSLVANGHNLSIVSASGGTIKGKGTVGTTTLEAGSTIAPGESPGILSTGNLTFVSGSTYEFELGGITVGTQYDQINVTGTVNLGSGTLKVILFGGFKPTVGQTFTIINNDAADAVSGTFAGLAQGASFTSEGYTYRISYTAGTGNDVVLTVLASSPDTGFGLILNNPLVTGGVMMAAALGILIVARRHSKALVRR